MELPQVSERLLRVRIAVREDHRRIPLRMELVGIRQRIRIQPREDGLSIDQIVLSDVIYASRAPGGLKNDATVFAANGGS